MKRAALYLRVSTLDQHPETQLYDLLQMAAQRDYQIVEQYTDKVSGAKARRPGLDKMMADARRGRFDLLLVWAADRLARSVKHFLEVLDELNHLNVEFVSYREQIDTGGPLGRAIVIIIGCIAELERSLIVERVRAGMRRAKLEGRHIGRKPLDLDRIGILRDRTKDRALASSRSLTESPAPPFIAFFTSLPRIQKSSRRQVFQKGSKNRPRNSSRFSLRYVTFCCSTTCGFWDKLSSCLRQVQSPDEPDRSIMEPSSAKCGNGCIRLLSPVRRMLGHSMATYCRNQPATPLDAEQC